jgi:hypothetical protein
MSDEKTPLEVSDEMAASVQKTPHRVTLQDIKDKIKSIEFVHPKSAAHVTIAVLTLDNGFVILGESAPADPGNYNAEKGRQFAEQDAMRKVWAFEGYLLRSKLYEQEKA